MYFLPGNMCFLIWFIYPPLINVVTCNALAQRASVRAISSSIFYSRASISIPLCLYSDSTNKLFSLNVPGAILWFWTDEDPFGFLIPSNWAIPEQRGDIWGVKTAPPHPTSPPANNLPLLEKFPQSLTGRKWSPITSAGWGDSPGRQLVRFPSCETFKMYLIKGGEN